VSPTSFSIIHRCAEVQQQRGIASRIGSRESFALLERASD